MRRKGLELARGGVGQLRDDAADGVVGVDGLDFGGEGVDEGPHLGTMRVVHLHLVAERPAEEGVVVLEGADLLQHVAPRRLKGACVGVVEAVLGVAEPEAGHEHEAVGLGFVELPLEVVGAPGAEGVAAGLREERLRRVAAGALHEEGLAVDGEVPGAGLAGDLDDGAGQGGCGQ